MSDSSRYQVEPLCLKKEGDMGIHAVSNSALSRVEVLLSKRSVLNLSRMVSSLFTG